MTAQELRDIAGDVARAKELREREEMRRKLAAAFDRIDARIEAICHHYGVRLKQCQVNGLAQGLGQVAMDNGWQLDGGEE